MSLGRRLSKGFRLISESYRELNRKLHERPDYGHLGHKWAKYITPVLQQSHFTSVLDYGCGKGTLEKKMKDVAPWVKVVSYDPCLEGREHKEPCDLVVCGDVLEHVEPEFLEDVIVDVKKLSLQMSFFAIGTTPATKNLPDGRNAHLTVQDCRYWLPLLWKHFEILSFVRRSTDIIVVAK